MRLLVTVDDPISLYGYLRGVGRSMLHGACRVDVVRNEVDSKYKRCSVDDTLLRAGHNCGGGVIGRNRITRHRVTVG